MHLRATRAGQQRGWEVNYINMPSGSKFHPINQYKNQKVVKIAKMYLLHLIHYWYYSTSSDIQLDKATESKIGEHWGLNALLQ